MKLAGKNPVYEKLRNDPQRIKKIYVQAGFSDKSFVLKKAKKHGIPVVKVLPNKMLKIGRSKNTQGILADIEDFHYADLDELLGQAVKKRRTLIFLDGVTDVQNLGAILRSLGCLGRFSAVLPTSKSVRVTETVLRIASGGENHVPIAQVSNINKAIKKAKEQGFTIIGTIPHQGESIYTVDLPERIGLVIGSEDKGIRPGVLKNLDLKVTIPMLVDTMSLNVAQATTIFCYEIIRQKTQK